MTAMITFDKGPAENRNAAPSTALASFCIFDVNVSKLLITPSTLSVEMVSTPLIQAGGEKIPLGYEKSTSGLPTQKRVPHGYLTSKKSFTLPEELKLPSRLPTDLRTYHTAT